IGFYGCHVCLFVTERTHSCTLWLGCARSLDGDHYYLSHWRMFRSEGWLVMSKRIDRDAILRSLQKIEEDDYDGFVLLVKAARNRNVVFDPDLSVWQVAQSMGIIVDCNRGGVPEFDEAMRDFVRNRENVDGSDKFPYVKGRH
ncbi:MAG: hypothetical protein ACRDRE_17040, partial [Pseudonocardiaceae bacterium]